MPSEKHPWENNPVLSKVVLNNQQYFIKDQEVRFAVSQLNSKMAETSAADRAYTDSSIANLIGTAPETLDTLGEIAKALKESETATGAIMDELGKKANTDSLAAIATSGDYKDLLNTPNLMVGDKRYQVNVSTIAPPIGTADNIITIVLEENK